MPGVIEGAKLQDCAIERVAGGMNPKDEHVQAGGWKVSLLWSSRLSSSKSDLDYLCQEKAVLWSFPVVVALS